MLHRSAAAVAQIQLEQLSVRGGLTDVHAWPPAHCTMRGATTTATAGNPCTADCYITLRCGHHHCHGLVARKIRFIEPLAQRTSGVSPASVKHHIMSQTWQQRGRYIQVSGQLLHSLLVQDPVFSSTQHKNGWRCGWSRERHPAGHIP